VLALGSNVGDREGFIRKAVLLLSEKIKGIKQASIYLSSPVGFTDQPDFYNTVISGYTDLSPEELLRFVKETERKVGRVKRFRWGPREIDIDVIFYGSKVLQSEKLTIPHPRMEERDFVLIPLAEVEPDFKHPVSGKTALELAERVKKSSIKKVIHNST